jgi:hypothetical protein
VSSVRTCFILRVYSFGQRVEMLSRCTCRKDSVILVQWHNAISVSVSACVVDDVRYQRTRG